MPVSLRRGFPAFFCERMEKNVKKLSLLISIAMSAAVLSSCGNNDRGSGMNHMYNAPLLGNPGSLDPQYADDPAANTVIKNLYSGLMTVDSGGNVVCCNAEDYTVSENDTVYTFRLREDNYWFFDENDDDVIDDEECFPVTADDYVYAIQRVLDPKMQSPYAKDFLCIKGAQLVADGLESPSFAEVYAADDHTFVAVLEKPDAEFLSLMASAAAYPCNRSFFDSTKGRYGLDDRSVMSNGPFYVRQWFYDPYGSNNILYMRRNEKNWTDSYDIMPSYLSFTIERSEEDIRKKFKEKEIDCFTTLSSSPYNPKKYSITGTPAITLGLVFNPEDRFFSNENMRRAVSCSMDRESLIPEESNDIQPAYGIIPPAVRLLGRSYRELASDKQFGGFERDKAQEYFSKAKEELGVESLEGVKVLVNTETVDSRALHSLSQNWQEVLGVYIGIDEVTPEEFDTRIAEKEYSLALYPLKADKESGRAVIESFVSTDCLKYAVPDEHIAEGITECAASELVDRYTAAEKSIIGGCGFVPLFYKNEYLIADSDNEDISYDPFTGAVDYRLAQNYG